MNIRVMPFHVSKAETDSTEFDFLHPSFSTSAVEHGSSLHFGTRQSPDALLHANKVVRTPQLFSIPLRGVPFSRGMFIYPKYANTYEISTCNLTKTITQHFKLTCIYIIDLWIAVLIKTNINIHNNQSFKQLK
jgi:hypothetical protein